MEAIVIGKHVMANSLVGQYESLGAKVTRIENPSDCQDVSDYDEICLMSDMTLASRTEADSHCLRTLRRLASAYDLSRHEGRRALCHLLVRSNTTLRVLQTADFEPEVNEKFDVYAFTTEDQWAKRLFAGVSAQDLPVPPLDRQPITCDSDKTVHLVLFGMTDMTESLAVHAALVAHYPNNLRQPTLRTRITIIDKNGHERRRNFLLRYHHLFDNSYYRQIDLCGGRPEVPFHRPMYTGVDNRGDFVDVEWEFVEADSHAPLVREKLELWAESKHQLLTIAICGNDDDENCDLAFSLPEAVYGANVPVLVRVVDSAVIDVARQYSIYNNVYAMGMQDCGYDVKQPLLQLAKRLNYFYACSFSDRGLPTVLPADEVEAEWREVKTFAKRYSNIYNVMTLPSKMRSLGHDTDDWGQFYALTNEEVELMAAVEHNRWNVEQLIQGFRPPTPQEKEDIRQHIEKKKAYRNKKVHYDLCAYDELGVDQTGKNVKVYDIDLTACIPLIVNSYDEERQ